MKKLLTRNLSLAVSLIFLLPGNVLCEEFSGDQKNKEIVYRIYNQYKREFPHVREISVSDGMKLYQDGKAVFVDLRTETEMKISTLPKAISKDEYLKNPSRFKGMTIIAFCTISYRSGIFASEMAKKGMTIYNLAGGLLAWVHEGGKVYNAGGETKRIHVYGDKWDYPPTGYEVVKFGFLERFIR